MSGVTNVAKRISKVEGESFVIQETQKLHGLSRKPNYLKFGDEVEWSVPLDV
jgi:hypothetical protein